MPWLTIIAAVLTFFSSKKSGASGTKALLTAGLVGAGAYYVTHNTDWGSANLGSLDGVPAASAGSSVITTPSGTPVLSSAGAPLVSGNAVTGSGFNIADVLKSWGATGTATVLGVGAAASGGLLSSSSLPWLIGGLALLLLAK